MTTAEPSVSRIVVARDIAEAIAAGPHDHETGYLLAIPRCVFQDDAWHDLAVAAVRRPLTAAFNRDFSSPEPCAADRFITDFIQGRERRFTTLIWPYFKRPEFSWETINISQLEYLADRSGGTLIRFLFINARDGICVERRKPLQRGGPTRYEPNRWLVTPRDDAGFAAELRMKIQTYLNMLKKKPLGLELLYTTSLSEPSKKYSQGQ